VNLALFDFDGTITTREMFADFMHYSVSRKRRAIGNILFLPLVIGYKLGVVSGNAIRSSVVHFGFRGAEEAKVSQFAQKFRDEVLPGVLRPQAMERIQWHKAQGDVVVVVSGGLDIYLAHWCRTQGLDLICSRLESKQGMLTGRYREAQCVGAEKRRRIAEKYTLSDFNHVYAYGDTKEDMAMLGMAHTKFFRGQEIA
jgi:phosphatidylglycerophosphatase C